MVIKKIIATGVFFIFLCGVTAQNNLSKNDFSYYEITNLVLKKELKNYMKAIQKYRLAEKVLRINVIYKEQFIVYRIFYEFYAYDSKKYLPIHLVSRIEGEMILFNFGNFNDATLKKEWYVKIAELQYPSAYEYYKKHGNWPVMPVTYDFVPTLILTFKNDSLIKKEKEYY